MGLTGVLLTAVGLVIVAQAQQNGTNVCPVFICGGAVPAGYSDRLCYLHNANSVQDRQLQVFQCPEDQICNTQGAHQLEGALWLPRTQKQDYTSSKAAGYCSDPITLYKNLQAGMPCQHDFQCNSKQCQDNICKGGFAGDPCTENTECSPNYYCGKATSRDLTWSFCIPSKTENEKCSSDWECQNAYICSRQGSSGSKTCRIPYSVKEGQKSSDARLCQSSFTTKDGICSSVTSVYQSTQGSTSCNVNVQDGYCTVAFNYDKSTRTDLIPCQCSLFDASAHCQWPGPSAAARFLQLLQRLYKESPLCSRAYLSHSDPLKIQWQHVKQCTMMETELFDELLDLAHQWTYAGVTRSQNFKEECLNVFALTSKAAMALISPPTEYTIALDAGSFIQIGFSMMVVASLFFLQL